jgi:aminoglycoside phosphotransferase family enzyme/predicted kinase
VRKIGLSHANRATAQWPIGMRIAVTDIAEQIPAEYNCLAELVKIEAVPMAVESHLPPLIQAMSRADFYPHPPESVELRQTHISYVFLAGDYVYKIKKPVRFPFLDYSTLERRRHFCREEIRLNRRLAPSVYLGIVAIARENGRFILDEKPGERAFEYAVKMRRLPEEHFLDRRIRAGKARQEDFHRIAAKLASFYVTASTDQALLYGSADAVHRKLAENVEELEPLIGTTLTVEEFRRIRKYNHDFVARHRDLLDMRLRDARVREGHGDLRAEHICLEDDPVIFDCIEFSEEFRYCDAASEIAFLCMELDYLGSPLLSEYFAGCFEKLTQDPGLSVLLPVYKAYRACVRGKVETLKSQEREVPEEERKEARSRARRYFHLAYRYTKPPHPPAILIVCGLVASGKSTIARALGDRTGYQILNSDVIRKQLAGIALTTHPASDYGKGMYSDEFNSRTYTALLKESEDCLKLGKGVIVDATFKDPQQRQRFIDLALRLTLPVVFVECRAPEAKILERLKMRAQRPGEVSDATPSVYARQREEFVPLTEISDAMRIIVNTESDIHEAAGRAWNSVRRILPAPG